MMMMMMMMLVMKIFMLRLMYDREIYFVRHLRIQVLYYSYSTELSIFRFPHFQNDDDAVDDDVDVVVADEVDHAHVDIGICTCPYKCPCEPRFAFAKKQPLTPVCRNIA